MAVDALWQPLKNHGKSYELMKIEVNIFQIHFNSYTFQSMLTEQAQFIGDNILTNQMTV